MAVDRQRLGGLIDFLVEVLVRELSGETDERLPQGDQQSAQPVADLTTAEPVKRIQRYPSSRASQCAGRRRSEE